MMSAGTAERPFSIREARALVADLMVRRPAIYWTDFIGTMAVAYSGAMGFLFAEWGSALQAMAFPVAVFGLFRLASFIHEVVHLPRDELPGFRIAWNLLAGVPLLIPSFLYENHLDHHRTRTYGTAGDGEYVFLGSDRRKSLARFFGQIFVLPLLVFLRFSILTPVSFVVPKLRRWIDERASALIINSRYRRDPITLHRRGFDRFIETLCSLRALAIPGLILLGWNDWTRIVELYLLAVSVLGLNHFRTLVSHRYESGGESMSHLAQFGDSINIEGSPIWTELFFPVGLRYHALHHLFPGIPYHQLGKAHGRLARAGRGAGAYLATTLPLGEALALLIRKNRCW